MESIFGRQASDAPQWLALTSGPMLPTQILRGSLLLWKPDKPDKSDLTYTIHGATVCRVGQKTRHGTRQIAARNPTNRRRGSWLLTILTILRIPRSTPADEHAMPACSAVKLVY